MARIPFVGGNWKMNTRRASAEALADQVAAEVAAQPGVRPGAKHGSAGSAGAAGMVEVAIFPPFPYLAAVRAVLDARTRGGAAAPLILGAQDVSDRPDGAFTGEVSAAMLADCGATTVLAGHSERRHVIGESDELVNAKVRAALAGGLAVVLCIGETLDQRQRGETDAVNARQLRSGLAGVSAADLARVVVAYEPVWAIGTGRTATPNDAQHAHVKVRAVVAGLYGPAVAGSVRIIYGGSCTAATAPELFARPDVDGGLIGGASLKSAEFAAIVRAAGARSPGG